MNPAVYDQSALDPLRERVGVSAQWKHWYDEASEFSEALGVVGRVRLSPGDFGRVHDEALEQRVRRCLDVDFEPLVDAAPPALAHSLGIIAAVSGHSRYSWPLLRAAAHAMPHRSEARRIGVHNWRLAALEAHAWSSSLEALQMLAHEAPPEVPFPMQHYEPLQMLGVGGFAEAYLCRDRASGELVVVKALARKPVEQWPRDVFHEVWLLRGLVHDGVPRVREAGYVDDETQGGPYCVLDYFDGLSLHQYLDRCGVISWPNLRWIMLSVLDTLEAVHEAGVVHCDVKPGNILLRCDSRGWRTQLIDFGIGILLDNPAMGARPDERRPGTLGFAAPEQLGCLCSSAITPAVDMYGLGQTAIYALNRQAPGKWAGERLIPGESPLHEVLLSCIHPDPRHRPRVDQLRRYLQQLEIHQDPIEHEHQTTRLPLSMANGMSRIWPAEPITGYGTVPAEVDGSLDGK